MSEWSLTAIHDVLTDAAPDRPMVLSGSVRRTHLEVADRARAIAGYLGERGIGLHTERTELARWEKGQDSVALVLDNCPEYLEAMLGSFRARAVPCNVNQHYRPAEVASLFADLDVRALVYHRRYAPLLAGAVDTGRLVLLDVDDGSGVAALPGSTSFEHAATARTVGSLPVPSPDDLYLVCTGGTTGRPKAVLWRQADIYVSAMGGAEGATEDAIADSARMATGSPWFALPPLMHAASQWTVYSGMLMGAPVLVHDDSGPFDPAQVLALIERERVFLTSIVGDAHARPLVEELRRGSYDVSSLKVLGTGGAATSRHLKDALLELIPELMIRDGYGSSETGGMAYGGSSRGTPNDGFDPAAGGTVLAADLTRELDPGDEEIGWTARRGRVPLGYLGDRARTEATFPILDGERMAIPGDRARRRADGGIELLGRDSMVVNTGGEKVFVEEVESVLQTHPDVADVVVVGRPSERFGEEVVAVVAPRVGATLDPVALREFVGAAIARFKAPRAVVVCDTVPRHANGKADYGRAKEIAGAAADLPART